MIKEWSISHFVPNHLTSCVKNFATPSIKPQQNFATPCHQFSFPCHPKTFLPPKHFSHPTPQHILPLYPKKLPLQPNKIFCHSIPNNVFATNLLNYFATPPTKMLLPLALPTTSLAAINSPPSAPRKFSELGDQSGFNQFKATLRVLPL